MVQYFHFLLAHFVCILYIDSLDQLSNTNMARSNVSFLDGIRPHPETRIVVSMLPDDDDIFKKPVAIDSCNDVVEKEEQIKVVEEPKYWYGPYTRMINDGVPFQWVRKLSDSSYELETIVSKLLLSNHNMTLSSEQMKYVVDQVSKYPTMLYLRLSLRVVSRWTSFSKFHNTLPPSIPSLINLMFLELPMVPSIDAVFALGKQSF